LGKDGFAYIRKGPDPLIRFAILTVSDRSAHGERPDLAGPALTQAIIGQGWQLVRQAILPDEVPALCDLLIEWADSSQIDVILTTGGTGFSPRDITPEATLSVIQRTAPGISEAMRVASLKITPHGMLSRAVSGIRGTCLIINLPGSPRAATENLAVVIPVLPHAVQLLHSDPNSEAGHVLHNP
jgi:molybdenum cofactor synthesis domain-containing protein